MQSTPGRALALTSSQSGIRDRKSPLPPAQPSKSTAPAISTIKIAAVFPTSSGPFLLSGVDRQCASLALLSNKIGVALWAYSGFLAGDAFALNSGILTVQILRLALPPLVVLAVTFCPLPLNSFVSIRRLGPIPNVFRLPQLRSNWSCPLLWSRLLVIFHCRPVCLG